MNQTPTYAINVELPTDEARVTILITKRVQAPSLRSAINMLLKQYPEAMSICSAD